MVGGGSFRQPSQSVRRLRVPHGVVVESCSLPKVLWAGDICVAEVVCRARAGTSNPGRFGRSSSVKGASDVVVTSSSRTAKRLVLPLVCGRAAETCARRMMSLEKAVLPDSIHPSIAGGRRCGGALW